MHSLRIKLLVGFVAVAVVAVGVVAVTAIKATDSAFAAYVRQGQVERVQSLQADLTDFYARNQSWANVQQLLNISGGMGRMMGPSMGMGRGFQGAAMMGQQTILADAQGTIIASVGAPHNGPRLSSLEMTAALPITVDGRIVGYVLAQGPGLSTFSALEEQFLATVNRGLLIASLIAGGLAIIVGLVVARHLSAPLVSMTQAAQAMAHGDLSQRVHVTSDDEVGRLAEAFNAMATSLERAEQLRRNLVADVAHELRTPIAVLRADLEALQDGVYEPTAERLAALQEETDLLARLVADLHDLSLAEAGQLTLERRPIDLAQVCQQAVTGMSSQASSRGVSLTLGDVDVGSVSVVDPDRIGQMLRNLISNAIRHTPAGGSITLDCRREGQSNVIAVRDTGQGIKPEDLPHVFERFYRGEKSRSRATGGAGLGLAIVKQLAEAHGGQVWVESTPGHGATFYVRLPGGEDASSMGVRP